jgi:hypothetical protein
MNVVPPPHEGDELSDLGAARAKEEAFAAVRLLWQKREREGVKKADLARRIGKNPSWVSRSLVGPGNWTIETLGALTEALDGILEIRAVPIEEADSAIQNYDYYLAEIDSAPHTECMYLYQGRVSPISINTNTGTVTITTDPRRTTHVTLPTFAASNPVVTLKPTPSSENTLPVLQTGAKNDD